MSVAGFSSVPVFVKASASPGAEDTMFPRFGFELMPAAGAGPHSFLRRRSLDCGSGLHGRLTVHDPGVTGCHGVFDPTATACSPTNTHTNPYHAQGL